MVVSGKDEGQGVYFSCQRQSITGLRGDLDVSKEAGTLVLSRSPRTEKDQT